MPSPRSMVLVFEIKGAIQRVAKDAMAFDHRHENFEMSIIAQWTDPAHDTENMRWARDVWTSAQPFVSPAVYANHLSGDESRSRVQSAYGPEKYEKLAKLKAKYDPMNFSCQNHNIAPQSTKLPAEKSRSRKTVQVRPSTHSDGNGVDQGLARSSQSTQSTGCIAR